MTIDEFVTELKVYLKIKETDIDNDEILLQSARAAAGFIISYYSYYIITDTINKEFYYEAATKKFYLDAGPVVTVTAYLDNVEVTDNTSKVLGNTVYYTDNLGVAGEVIKLESLVGVSNTNMAHIGDIAQATALAAYFYKQADKGLDGVMQYGTGIKESARLYEGIPKAILQHFEARKIYRF